MDAGLDAFMRDLAAQEQRPVEEITADLLARGLVQRGLDEQLALRWKHLSPREQEVTALSCLGYTNGQIAARLGVAKETVKTYSINAQRKFDVRSKAELIRMLDVWDFSEYNPVPKDDQDA
jgi:DNA-binding NarL/FixJ family response regulator